MISAGRFPRAARAVGLAVLAAALAAPSASSAHAIVGPQVSIAQHLQLYSLAVPTEKENATTTKIELTVPRNFSIDSFAPSPAGWIRSLKQSGSGKDAVITQVTWSGGKTATGEASLFQFLAQPASSGSYRFTVRQTYSDGSVVDWSGTESSDSPAPVIEVKDSLGGGGNSALGVIALIIALVALLAAVGAGLAGRGREGGRPLA